jgi:hypothetical protein
VLTNNEKYLIELPQDPNGDCSTYGICYEIQKTLTDRIAIFAPDAENDAIIEVTR